MNISGSNVTPRRIIETEINNNTKYPVAEEGATVVKTFLIIPIVILEGALRFPIHIVAK